MAPFLSWPTVSFLKNLQYFLYMIASFDAHIANVVVFWKLYLYILSLGFSGPKTRWPPLFKHKMKMFCKNHTYLLIFGYFSEGHSRSLIIFSLPHVLAVILVPT